MSQAWETTTEDVRTVLTAHGIVVDKKRLEKIIEDLDHDAIEDGLLNFTSMEAQTDSMFEDIELQLIGQGVIPQDAEKKFTMADQYEDDDDEE